MDGIGEGLQPMGLGRSLASGRVARRWAAVAGLFLLYLLSPLLGSTHVEGFTAQIQIGAIAAGAGRLDDANLLYPLHAEFFYLTRVGVVLLLQGLMRLVGTGDVAFRILTGVSFLVYAGAAVAVARRHSGAGWPALAAALALTPGIAELGFYFNDNVVSAAFGTLGLAVLPRAPGTERLLWAVRGVLAGALLGWAVVSRPDALLLLPVAAGFAWLDAPRWRIWVGVGALVAAGLLAAWLLAYGLTGATVLQALQVGRFFDGIQASFRRYSVSIAVFVLFFGLPNLLLLPLGVWLGLRGGGWRKVGHGAVLVALPLLLLAFMARSATETRHMYPLLAPFIVIHGARGLEWLVAGLASAGARRGWAAAGLAAIAAVWVAPPVLVPVTDGPRAVVGRVWSPLLWLRWQAAVRGTLSVAAGLAAPQAARTAVLTTSFNPDHYLRLRLWQAGWQPVAAGAAWPGCGGFEAWRRNGMELDHIRTENPHLMAREPAGFVEAVQVQRAFGCPQALDGAAFQVFDVSPHYFDSAVMDHLYREVPGLRPVAASFGWPPAVAAGLLARLTPWQLGILAHATPAGRVAALGPDQVRGLRAVVDRVVESSDPALKLAGYDHLMAAFRRGAWRAPPG